ncbi:MAG: MFS transporter [Burkholderiaceae bacterium]|nr:MFS transporter [Roseateles sp.]MBV8470471.1 MFS transporter [Burkholderiaceae bacterium]
MLAQRTARWLQRRELHFSWVVMAVAFMTMLSSSAALGLPGVFMQPLVREMGWGTDQISSALAVRFLLYGLMGPFAALLMERYGLRRIVCSAMVLIALALLLSTRMTALWQLMALWGVMLGVSSGMTALVLAATVANRWFSKRRGLVLGVLTASNATGQLIFLPLAARLIELLGWRMAIMPAFCMCLFTAVLAFAFMRDHPQDVGLNVYGVDPQEQQPVHTWRPDFWEPLRQLAQASQSGTFWVLFGTFFICGLSTSGLVQTHFVSLCGDYGLAAVPAASVLAMMGAFDFVGTIASGWLSDRFDNRKLLFWYYGLRGLSLLWLPHADFTIYGLSLFAMFYGLDWIATVPPTVKLVGASFDRQRSPMIFGWIFAGHQLGSACAAYGAGLSRSVLLSYEPALYIAGAACLVAALGIFLVRRPAAAEVRVAAS